MKSNVQTWKSFKNEREGNNDDSIHKQRSSLKLKDNNSLITGSWGKKKENINQE